jgi:hypothetical protein
MGPRTGLDDVERENSSTYRDSNSDPSAVQPVARRYTDCPSSISTATKLQGLGDWTIGM